MKKILIITPRSPFQGRGADEQDRLAGIKWFIKQGHEVRVITMALEGDMPYVEQASQELGIQIVAVRYKFRGRKDWLKRLFNPLYWDGAAYEYFDHEIQNVVSRMIREFHPNIVWFDYTYLWPLYKHARKASARIITRSINFEPVHFLDEDGRMPSNYVRAIPKLLSEVMSFRWSDYFLTISPKEEMVYRKLGKVPVATLPLRSLPRRVGLSRPGNNDGRVHIGFMSSTYNVHHNREALSFIIEKVYPLIDEDLRKRAVFHITGNKLPKSLHLTFPPTMIYEGFVPSSIDFWLSMDIALVPSVFGAGMQQKIFEPITIGVPTITTSRGLAGYPLECGVEVICADSAAEIAEAVTRLALDSGLRKAISRAAQSKATNLFSQERIDVLINSAVVELNK